MDDFVYRRGRSCRGAADASVAALWSQLKSHLERRSSELSGEVRHYPTPIARCDEQLTKLIEQRTRALTQLERVAALDPRQLERLRAFVASAEAEDEIEAGLLARLRAALTQEHTCA